jgi:hypothetical protein
MGITTMYKKKGEEKRRRKKNLVNLIFLINKIEGGKGFLGVLCSLNLHRLTAAS